MFDLHACKFCFFFWLQSLPRKGHRPRDKRIQLIYELGGMTLPGDSLGTATVNQTFLSHFMHTEGRSKETDLEGESSDSDDESELSASDSESVACRGMCFNWACLNSFALFGLVFLFCVMLHACRFFFTSI